MMQKPVINDTACVGCGACASACDYDVIDIVDYTAEAVSPDYCVACGSCQGVCPTGAIAEFETIYDLAI